MRDEILSKNTRVLLPMFEAALAGEISYGQNMSCPASDFIPSLFHFLPTLVFCTTYMYVLHVVHSCPVRLATVATVGTVVPSYTFMCFRR